MEFDQKMHRRLGRKLGIKTAGQAQALLIALQAAQCRYGEAGENPASIGSPIPSVPIGANYEKSLAIPNSSGLFRELSIARFYQMNRLKEDILHLRKKYARLRAQIKGRRLDLRFKLAVLNGVETDFCDASNCPSQQEIAASAVCSLSQQVQMLRNEYEIGERALQFRVDQLQWVKRNLEVSTIDNIKAETKNQEVTLRDAVNKATALRVVAQFMYEKLLQLVNIYENHEELKHSIIAAKLTLDAERTATDKDEDAIELRQFKHNLISRLPPEQLHSRDVSCPSEFVMKDLEEFMKLMKRASAMIKIYAHLRAPLAEFRVS